MKNIEEKIKQAYIANLEKKDISAISVASICNTAGCSRTTFYKHFKSPRVLLDSIKKDLLDYYCKEIMSIPSFRNRVTKLLTLIRIKRRLFSIIIERYNPISNLYSDSMTTMIYMNFKKQLLENGVTENDITFLTSGAVGLIFNWVREGCREPVENITDCICKQTGL